MDWPGAARFVCRDREGLSALLGWGWKVRRGRDWFGQVCLPGWAGLESLEGQGMVPLGLSAWFGSKCLHGLARPGSFGLSARSG